MNVFELFAKLGVDTTDYDKGLDNAEKKGSGFASKLGKALGTAAKATAVATTAAVGAATTGIVTLTTKAVNAYGNYEQLVGGVNKIFGDSAKAVMQNADKAFSTAGMSANQYMETVTGFSASLIKSLGGDTKKAVDLADTAIRDMSDNANTFGTDIKSIMNAYQGFSKQNYTMLDNLKLGYGGTKTEMERLIKDAEKLDDTFSVTHTKTKKGADQITYSYADVVKAINIVQKQMGITGTTAKEASETIQGTAGSLKGAWDNLIIGLGNVNTDLKPLIDNVVKSALQMVNNIKPIALQAVKGIASLIEGFAPVLASELPKMIQELLPALMNAVVMLINSVSKALPPLISTILPTLIQAVTGVIMSLLQALPQILQVLSAQLPLILQQLIPAILTLLPLLVQTGIEFILAIAKGIADNIDLLMDAVMKIIHYLVDELLTVDNLEKLINVSLQIILAIAGGIIKNIPEILGAITILMSNILVALGESLPDIGEQVIKFIVDLGTAFGNKAYDAFGAGFTKLLTGVTGWLNSIKTSIGNFVADGIQYWVDFGKGIGEKIGNAFKSAKELFSKGIQALKDMLKFDWSLPQIKLPHFKISGGEAPWGFAGKGSMPKVEVKWYEKAMNNPYLLEDATIFGSLNGSLLGAGESGKELVYGHEQLMADIGAVIDARLANMQFVVPVYIGGKKIDQQIIMASARNSVISGGR